MPSSHAPIKKYNYERSLFRWVMSRHPEPFEKHGITTRTLERAPLAREAFYTSDWPGARALVQSNDESKYERTAFFDAIIERGLRNGTRFSIDHVTNEEKSKLGITMDRASGKYYLAAYGSPKARRGSSRRGSQTSSDGEAPELPHMVIKEVEDILTSEIEAAGENAEVMLVKKSAEEGSTRGSKLLNFSVSIRRRSSGTNGGNEPGREKEEGAGAGPPMTPAADAGAGKTTATLGGTGASAGAGNGAMTSRRQGSAPSTPSDSGARQVRDGSSPRQTNGRDTGALSNVPSKSRGRPPSTVTGEDFPAQPSSPNKRRNITKAVFGNPPRLAGEQGTPVSGLAGETMRFGRTDATARGTQEMDIKPTVRSPSGAQLPAMFASTGTSSSTPFAPISTRPELSWGGGFPQRNGMRMPPSGHMPPPTSTNGGTNGSVLPSPPLQSWHVQHSSQTTRNDEYVQLATRSGVGRSSDSGASESGTSTTPTLGCGSLTTSSQQQHHLPSMPSFGHRPSGPSNTIGRVSPSTMVVPEQHTSGMSGLNVYSSHVRQSHLTGMGNLHGATSWGGTSNRISGALGNGNREAVDEEDIDFLASFF